MVTKICPKCGLEKLIDDFARNKAKKDGHAHCCKVCQNVYGRNHYKNNTEYYKKKARKRDAVITQWYREFKSELICEICGENHVACIEFHHEDPTKKEANLSTAVNYSWGIKRLKSEIKKCKIVCSNCHRKLHYDKPC